MSLIIRKMQIKTTKRYHLTFGRIAIIKKKEEQKKEEERKEGRKEGWTNEQTSVDKDTEKLESLYTVGGNTN